jgi:hypothetical protein
MSIRAAVRAGCIALILALPAPPAAGYITYPPMTLQKMCDVSSSIRVLKITRHSKDKGVILFKVVETLKKRHEPLDPGKQVVPKGANGVGPVLDWAGEGKTAVLFSIDGTPRGGTVPIGVGYVFIDGYCYFVDYSPSGKYWLVVRGDPGLSACYHGPAAKLRDLVRDVLAGKKVQVPTKEPAVKEDVFKRNGEIERIIIKNRKR